MRLRLAVLWAVGPLLVAGGLAASWAYAVGSAERFATFPTGPIPEPEINWAVMLNSLVLPLLIAGTLAVLVAIVTQAVLWRPEPREP